MWSVVIILLALSGCSIEKVSAQKQDKIEYTILKEAEFPEKVQELIEENKTKEFQLTYQEQGNLYLIKGYGEQKTGGYSIRIEDVSLWECHTCTDYADWTQRRKFKRRTVLSVSGYSDGIQG